MKVIFCSNYMNHHQLFFSQAMLTMPNVEYYFIASEKITAERENLGWKDLNSEYSWIIRAYENEESFQKAAKLVWEADLVITGSYPIKRLRKRILCNKPVFLYSERWFKTSDGKMDQYRNLHYFLSDLLHRKYLNFRKVYMLCASAYTAYDCSLYHNFKNKCFKWGYFPETIYYDLSSLMDKKKEKKKIQLLWVARFIEWKHPETAVEIASRLLQEGIDFELNMVGAGPLEDTIREKIEQKKLSANVHLCGAKSPEEVRKYMEQADIFLFTSDFNEGWGAVLNEAMNSGCAVAACHAIGSVPFLIDDKKNGFIYNLGDMEELYSIVRELVLDGDLRRKIGAAAYRTITEEWSAEVAAKRVVLLYKKLIQKEKIEIDCGVCSKAEVLDNFWR